MESESFLEEVFESVGFGLVGDDEVSLDFLVGEGDGPLHVIL